MCSEVEYVVNDSSLLVSLEVVEVEFIFERFFNLNHHMLLDCLRGRTVRELHSLGRKSVCCLMG
jgi:hypothetical protein